MMGERLCLQWLHRRSWRRLLLAIALLWHTSYMTAVFMKSKPPLHRRLSEGQTPTRPKMPLRPWLDPPNPPITGKVWNTTNIKWVGKSFYFANKAENSNSLQLYTPHQIQKAFRRHSTLLQGDSTVRRLYGTLHGILSYDVWTGSASADFPRGFPAQVPNPPLGVPATYFVRRGYEVRAKGINPETLLPLVIHSPAPIDPRLLNHRTIVDVNKDFYTEPCDRSLPPSYTMHSPSYKQQPSEGDIEIIDGENSDAGIVSTFKSTQFEYKVCRKHPTGGWIPPIRAPPDNAPLLYDYINTNCLAHIHEFVGHELSKQQSITRQYSLYIVGPGVWETMKQSTCHHPLYESSQSTNGQRNGLKWPETLYQLLHDTLEKLSMLAEQSPDLLIMWRTSGYYDGDAQSHVIHEMNRRAIEFIDDWNGKQRQLQTGRKSNFLCMDFGSAVHHRSHGKQRLRGDMQAHYSLEVRILQVQLIANLLYEYGYAI